MGATTMIMFTIWMMTEVRPPKKSTRGLLLSFGISTRAIPKRREKKTTWSMRPLLLRAPKMLSGVMSTKTCSGPRSFADSARSMSDSASDW